MDVTSLPAILYYKRVTIYIKHKEVSELKLAHIFHSDVITSFIYSRFCGRFSLNMLHDLITTQVIKAFYIG